MSVVKLFKGNDGDGGNTEQTMTSLQIAVLVKSRHDSVKRTIERLINKEIITQPPMVDECYTDGSGRTVFTKVYLVNERSSYIVVAQLSPEFLAAVVDEWTYLKSAHLLPDFNNPVIAARAWADKSELAIQLSREKVQLEHKVKELEPKAAALDAFADATGLYTLSNAAKTLGIRPKDLITWMSQKPDLWIFKRGGKDPWIGYQVKCQLGLLDHKSKDVEIKSGEREGEIIVTAQVVVTPRGLTVLAQRVQHLIEAEVNRKEKMRNRKVNK